ncbi:aldo/keto reductase [Flagellimonas flava]|uniref:aldo/keto reductase n=1 Tax=Flagellimonas flava TaxID=570519 RepID=UPI003D64F679
MKNMYSRRDSLKLSLLAGLGLSLQPSYAFFNPKDKVLTRPIPKSGEALPVVGLGTWQTFDVGNSVEKRKLLTEVLTQLHGFGGSVIDSSPMYGSSEKVVGDLAGQLDFQKQLFYATKVWTSGKQAGIRQMVTSFKKMGVNTMDLMQIHNLVDWKTHVKTLKDWKAQGKIHYWGITHYVDSSHESLERIIAAERPDFVQFNYSIIARHAEKSLFQTAHKYEVATLINQPYGGGSLFGAVRGKNLPGWAKEWDIHSWGQFFLKFILSNPHVGCVIPGTSKPHHMIDNMGAGLGRIPNRETREKMASYIKSL